MMCERKKLMSKVKKRTYSYVAYVRKHGDWDCMLILT